jgi:hypothetical protein
MWHQRSERLCLPGIVGSEINADVKHGASAAFQYNWNAIEIHFGFDSKRRPEKMVVEDDIAPVSRDLGKGKLLVYPRGQVGHYFPEDIRNTWL